MSGVLYTQLLYYFVLEAWLVFSNKTNGRVGGLAVFFSVLA